MFKFKSEINIEELGMITSPGSETAHYEERWNPNKKKKTQE